MGAAQVAVPPRTVLQVKPSQASDAVKRQELLGQLSERLKGESFVLFYGLSKIGKSQLISALIDHADRTNDYFWFTFSGDAGDLDRLTKQLTIWAGSRTGKRQLKDDLEKAGLPPPQIFERLNQFVVGEAWLVLDDCHKSADAQPFDLLRALVCQAWSKCRLILVSERKIPAAAAAGFREIPIGGLSPKEAVFFAPKLGLYLTDSLAIAQFAGLSIQVDGHPVMLRAAVKDLPPTPTATDILALSERIPSIASAEHFLADLSGRIFFGLLRTQEQRTWLSRLAVIRFPFTEALALRLAALQPRLQISLADWRYLKSSLLDEQGANRYSVPALLQQIAGSLLLSPEKQLVLTAAARHVFQRAVADGTINFWDFQSAILTLLAAERHEEAATRFVFAYPSLMESVPLRMAEPLFLLLNSEHTHARIADQFSRWSLLQAELYLRLQDPGPLDRLKAYSLIRRMRVQAKAPIGRGFRYAWAMSHLCIALLKLRNLKDDQKLRLDQRYRVFSPLQRALRIAVSTKDPSFVVNTLHFFDFSSQFATRPDVELLKEAILLLPEDEPLPVSVHALVTLYSKYAFNSCDADARMGRVEAHAALYLAAGRGEAYFACEHAAATILHERLEYRLARERMETLLAKADALGLSSAAIAHGVLLIADIYWSEGIPAESAERYEQILHAELGGEFLHQFVCERLCDSLILLGRYEKATNIALSRLRSERRTQTPEAKARLYGRLAYAYAEHGALRKAAIACLGLFRVAALVPTGAIDPLAGMVAGWVLAHFPQSDPLLSSGNVQIRNSAALSETITPEKMSEWREYDPFRAKAPTLVGAIFEKLEDWRRSERLYRKALAVVPRPDHASKPSRQATFAYLVVLARVHIRLGKFEEAAGELHEAARYGAELRLQEQPEAQIPACGVCVPLKAMAPALDACADDQLITFFDALYAMSGTDATRAWLRYEEGEILFSRLAVQSAKKRFNEAMQLARASSEHELYVLIVQQKFFHRVDQFYTRQDDWLRAAVEVTLVLARDEKFAAHRSRFAGSVYQIANGTGQGSFAVIAAQMSRFQSEWQNNSFWVAAYGIWRAAAATRILAGALNELESTLKARAAFLNDSDFA
ncbi:MAG TPA: hypothetical protein VIY49_39295 [Bryobacteraceae bacterium]